MAPVDDKLKTEEERRIGQFESVKGEFREEVRKEIARKAGTFKPEDESQVKTVARKLKDETVKEVAATEAELARAQKIARLSQVIDYFFYLIYGIVGLLILLELLGARESNDFKQFIDTLAAPVLVPFQGLMPDPAVGSFQLMLSYIIALVVYMLLHMAINGLLRLFVHKKTAV